jgi:sterol desaturase/sphingolipid hydroxylase (fatty acid hydroxylase superfamily)
VIQHLIGIIIGSPFLWFVAAVAVAERLRPCARPVGVYAFNLRYAVVSRFVCAVLSPVMSPVLSVVSITAVNRLGGGLVRLPEHGLGLVWAIPLYLVAMDTVEYWVHRAQHIWPLLWSMHALHHSDRALNLTSTLRHHWLEPFMRAVLVYPIVGLLVRPSPLVLAIYAAGAAMSYVSHMNVRLSYGKLWPFLTGPQFHRIHHAADPAYYNCNFCVLFPFIDVLFGTAHRPGPGEFPPPGLTDVAPPAGMIEAMWWPLRPPFARSHAAAQLLRL